MMPVDGEGGLWLFVWTLRALQLISDSAYNAACRRIYGRP